MRTGASLTTLVQELVGDAAEIDRLLARNRTAWQRIRNGADDPIDWGALGYTIYTLYSVLENYFLRVSKAFENNLPGHRWHHALVERMALDIPNLRPAFLVAPGESRDVREILRFRHRFRHPYGEDLDPGKTAAVQEIVVRFFARFPELHRDYCRKLKAIADAL